LLGKYLLVSELHIAHIIRWVFFDNNFQSLNLACVVVCSRSSWAWRFLEDISQGSVATRLRCGGIFNYYFCCKFITESKSERILKIG